MSRELILLRTSERTTFKRCRWAWDVSYNQGLKPRTSSPALRFGTLVHKALELRYKPGKKRGPHPAKTFAAAYEKELDEQIKFGFKDEDGTWHDALELGVDLMNHFVDVYGTDDEWEVVSSEQQFRVLIKQTKLYELWYVGTIDGVWRKKSTGELWFIDWKTAKSISTSHLTLDEQAGAYWTFGPEWLKAQGILKPGDELQGIMFSFLRKAKRDTRPQNELGHYLNSPSLKAVKELMTLHNQPIPKKGEGTGKDGTVVVDDLIRSLPAKLRDQAVLLGEVSSNQPSPYFERVPVYRPEAMREAVRARVLAEAREMRLVRAGKLDVIKSPGAFTCPMCSVRDMCELHESGQDWEAFRDATMTKWDGYAEHELANEGK